MKMSHLQTRLFKLLAMALDAKDFDPYGLYALSLNDKQKQAVKQKLQNRITKWQVFLKQRLNQIYQPFYANQYTLVLQEMEKVSHQDLKILDQGIKESEVFVKIANYKTQDLLSEPACLKLLSLLEMILLKHENGISLNQILNSPKTKMVSSFLKTQFKDVSFFNLISGNQLFFEALINECFSQVDISQFPQFKPSQSFFFSNQQLIEIENRTNTGMGCEPFFRDLEENLSTSNVRFEDDEDGQVDELPWDRVLTYPQNRNPNQVPSIHPITNLPIDQTPPQNRTYVNPILDKDVKTSQINPELPKPLYEDQIIPIRTEAIDPLAFYFYADSRIELYAFKIKACAQKYGFQLSSLFKVVFVHELGHYFSHKALNQGQDWQEISRASSYLSEGIAQFYTRAVLSVLDQGAFLTYLTFVKNQPSAYQPQELWVKYFSQSDVINAFLNFRRLSLDDQSRIGILKQRYLFESILLNMPAQKSYQVANSHFTMIYCPSRILNPKINSHKNVRINDVNQLNQFIDDIFVNCRYGFRPFSRHYRFTDIWPWIDEIEKKIKNGQSVDILNPTILPQTEVSPFWISQTHVTQQLWLDIMGWIDQRVKIGANLPAVAITHFDCLDFCNRLSKRSGLKPYYDLSQVKYEDYHIVDAKVQILFGNGYRLPSQAEWLVAAHADCGFKYAGSNRLQDVGWQMEHDQHINDFQPVAQKLPNFWGIFDMSGNVNDLIDNGDCLGGAFKRPVFMCRIDQFSQLATMDLNRDFFGLRLAQSL